MNLKYKKNHKKKIKNINFNKLKADFMGIRILESCRLTAKQLEAIRRVFVRETKREGSFFIRVQNNQLLTKKSKGSRMGKGVGSADCWVIDVKPGIILFEFTYYNEKVIKKFLSGIKGKLPAKSEILYREY